MKEQDAEDLLGYLRELRIAGPALTAGILKSPGFESVATKGCIYPGADRMQFDYRISKQPDGTFEVASYHVRLLEIPGSTIAHLGDLEERLKAVAWDLAPVDVALRHPDTGTAVGEVLALQQRDPEAASLLMAKYWSYTPMEQMSYFDHRIELPAIKELTHALSGDYQDLDLLETYNLLKGRGVMKSELREEEGGLVADSYWLIQEGKDLLRIPGYDVDAQVRQLSFEKPLTADSFEALMAQLYKGEQVACPFRTPSGRTDGVLQADPKNQTLLVTGMDNQQIALGEITKQLPENKASEKAQTKISPKRRSRGHGL